MTNEFDYMAHRIGELEKQLQQVQRDIPTIEELSKHEILVEFRRWTREEITSLRKEIATIRSQQIRRGLRITEMEKSIKDALGLAKSANTRLIIAAASIGGASFIISVLVGTWLLISSTILPRVGL